MSWISQVTVDTSVQVDSGWCLSLAESCTGAPHLYPTAKEAANNSDLHADRDYPTDAVVALFWDWTSKSDGIDYGHVVINVPGQGLFSSPKNWGQHGNDWYGSIDEVSNWLSATYLGWSPTLAGLTLSTYVADGATPAAAPADTANQRTAGADGAHRRAEPNTTSENLQPDLEAGAVGNFVGWIHGEDVSGNDVWYQGVSGNWFWSGAFTDSSTNGIADGNPAPVAAPPVVEAPAPVVVAPVVAPVVEAPVVTPPVAVIPATPPVVDAPVVYPTGVATLVLTKPNVPVVDAPVVTTPVVDVPVAAVAPVVEVPAKEPIVASVPAPTPVAVVLTAEDIAKQQAQIASLPAEEIGAIISTAKGRKIAYSVFAGASLVVTNAAIGYSTLQQPFPAWLLVAIGIVGNLAIPFSALALSNAKSIPAA